jgi:NADPH2:quinone reductase
MTSTALLRNERSSLEFVADDDAPANRCNRRIIGGRKSACRIAIFYLSGALVFAGNLLPNGKRVLTFQVAKLRDRRPEWFREDATTLFKLLADRKIAPLVAERIPLVEARRSHENLGHGGITGKQVLICDSKS